MLDVVLRRANDDGTDRDYQLSQIGRAEYWNIPSKSTEARPTQWFLDKQVTPRLYFWPASENATDKLYLNRLIRIEDADAAVNTVNMPFRFYPCLAAGLAYYIAMKRAPDRIEFLKSVYEEEFARASDQDESRASLMVAPALRSYKRA
mgnify:FL=1